MAAHASPSTPRPGGHSCPFALRDGVNSRGSHLTSYRKTGQKSPTVTQDTQHRLQPRGPGVSSARVCKPAKVPPEPSSHGDTHIRQRWKELSVARTPWYSRHTMAKRWNWVQPGSDSVSRGPCTSPTAPRVGAAQGMDEQGMVPRASRERVRRQGRPMICWHRESWRNGPCRLCGRKKAAGDVCAA